MDDIKNQTQKFFTEFDAYIQKLSEFKNINKIPNKEIMIDEKPHIDFIKQSIQNLESIYININKENENIKDINEFIINKIILTQRLFSYEDKKQFMEFLLNKNKENKDKINFIDNILKDIENNDRIKFEEKDDYKFYEYLFLKVNYINGNFEYTENETIIITKCYNKILNTNYIKNYFNIFIKQNNAEIIKEMSYLLYQIYNYNYEPKLANDPINDLIRLSKPYIVNNINIPCMELIKYIIEQKEKLCLIPDVKSHENILKKNLVKISITNEKKEDIFYFYENTIISEIINFIKNKYGDFYNYELINGENIVDKNDYNKTLGEITKDKQQLKIDKKPKEKVKLIENGQLSDKLRNVLLNIFNTYSNNKDFMNIVQLRNCFSKAINKEIKVKDLRIYKILKKYGSNYEEKILKRDEFLKFFLSTLKEKKEVGNELVWKNLKNFEYDTNLDKIKPIKNIEKNNNIRYYLSNKINEEIPLFNELIEKNKESNNINLLNFILFLSTNIDSYNKLLEKDFTKQENKFLSKPKNYIENMYDLIIIESILEDLEIKNMKENDRTKDKLPSEKSLPFYSDDNYEKKKNFFINFIKNNYLDLIEYITLLLKQANENGINNKEIIPMIYSKGISIINNIYGTLFDIVLKKSSSNYVRINSPNKLIRENKLEEYITNYEGYKNIIEQIIIFINKYHNNENVDDKLMKNCYYLLFYLIYTSNQIFEYINNNEQIKNIFNCNIQNDIFNNKNILLQLIVFTNKIKKKNPTCLFISYIIDLFINIIKNTDVENLNKIILNTGLFSFINAVFNFDLKDNKDKIKSLINDIHNNIYNIIKEINLNNIEEQKSNNLIINIKLFKKLYQKGTANIYEEIINTKINKEKTLYEIILDIFFSLDKDKLIKNKEQFIKIKETIDSPENKFISYDEFINIMKAYNMPKENELIKELCEYCSLCFYLIKSNNEDKLKNIFNKQNELKQLQEENIITYNSLVNKDNKEINFTRKKYRKYTGMKNLSTTCYLNSVIQLLFMIPEFRYLILSLNDGKDKQRGEYLDDDNTFHQLQILFTNLLLTSDVFIIPQNFFLSLKDSKGKLYANVNEQRDSQEFYLYICDTLESILKSIPPQQYLIKNFFGGKISHISECTKCKNLTYNYEEFKSLSLDIDKIKNLEESLNKYIIPEKIESYNCEKCEKKVSINRKSLISKLPNYLVIHLKRLVKNLENDKLDKKNSRFEFPIKLNIKKYYYTDKNEENKDIYYEYNLKGINIHNGNAEGGHFTTIAKEDNEKWYKFDDTIISEFDMNNLDNECFGGEDKFKTAYLLFYEKEEKQPIIKTLNENEVKEKQNVEIIEYNLEENNDIFDENKIYLDKKENIYYKFEKWDLKVNKMIFKEYFLEIFTNSKIYFKLLSNDDIYNFDDYIMKILLSISNDKLFNINNYNNEIKEYFINIFLNTILSYYFRESFNEKKEEKNEEKEKNIIIIIQKIIKPIIDKDKTGEKQIYKILELINNILLKRENILVIFSKNSVYNEEITKEMYELISSIIKINNQENNKKIFKNLNHIINDSKDSKSISFYIYQILFDFFKNKILDKINLEDAKNLFMPLFYKLFGEKNEQNIKNISNILNYLIENKNIFNEEDIKEIKLVFNMDLVITLFNINSEFLSALVKKLQFNDTKFTDTFNTVYIMKLYTYCEKNQTKENKLKYKLLKFIISIFELVDKYTIKRLETLLGYASLVFKNHIHYGIYLMNNDIKKEIFEYISYNHIKKERCILAHLFPSIYLTQDDNNNLSLEENDRLDLIYELILISLGLNKIKKGNYFLFKFLFLMQSRSINYENLYQEMKTILEKANNKKYDLASIKSKESKCIEVVNYEKENMEYIINMATGSISSMDFKKKKYKIKPELSQAFEECKEFLNDKINMDLYGTIVNIVPYEIQKVMISLIASNDNISIFRFEYFTNYFTKKELLTFDDEKKQFSFDYIKRENKEAGRFNGRFEEMKYEDFLQIKDFNQFLKEIDIKLKDNNGIVIQNYLIDDDQTKKTIIRYFVLSKKKNNVFKISGKTIDIPKDIEKNYYLPNLIFDCAEKEKDKNVMNIHRIKHNFNFLEDKYFGISLSNINYDKYFNEYFN